MGESLQAALHDAEVAAQTTPREELLNRAKRLQSLMREAELDGVMATQNADVFYISGVVRPIDIDQENSVKSSMVADAEIEFVGRGVLTDNQKQGWLSRFLGWVWPF